jgi:uncharacterized protein
MNHMEPAGGAVRRTFVGTRGVRNGWRFAAFAVLWYVGDRYVGTVLNHLYTFSATGFTPTDILVFKAVDALYLLLVSLLLVRVERHRPSWFGFTLERRAVGLFGMGCVWGFAIVTLLLLICWAGHAATFGGLALHGAPLWKYLALWLAGMLLVGLDEELQFRGYALSSLTRGIGFWPAALLLSLGFAADHMGKPMETVADLLNIALLGVFVCYTVRRTGSIWFAVGFHAAFDFFALSLYGSPNTGNNGLPLDYHLLEITIAGPAWLTGGPQGLEASWLVPPLVIVMCLLLRKLYPATKYPHD